MIYLGHPTPQILAIKEKRGGEQIIFIVLYLNLILIQIFLLLKAIFTSRVETIRSDMFKATWHQYNAIRIFLTFAVWQSIRHLRMSNSFDSIYEIFARAKITFLSSAGQTSIAIIAH